MEVEIEVVIEVVIATRHLLMLGALKISER
jgi:hypothetical protein